MSVSILFPVLLLLVALLAVRYTRKLTPVGTLTAGLLAVAIYQGCGYSGIALLGGFFVLGTGVTLWRRADKIAMGVADAASSRRNAGQVLANGGVAGVLGGLAWAMPGYSNLCVLLMAGAFAAAAADTVSSELGVLYGRRCFNILTLRPDKKGLDGVISWEGTLLGMAGALLMGLILWAGTGIQALGLVVVAGTCGNLLDSWLGARFERGGLVSNDLVNLLNTSAGAAVMTLLWWLV